MAADTSDALPAEIRLLAEFLDGDERPALVVEDEHYSVSGLKSVDVGVVYSNAAYKSYLLARLGLEREVREEGRAKVKRADSGGLHLGKEEWSVRPVGRRWTVVVGSGRAAVEGGDRETGKGKEDEEGIDESVMMDTSGAKSLDWTRDGVDGLSPWIQTVRDFDWSLTRLGPMSQWPSQLRHAVVQMMYNPDPRLMLWGEASIMIYNEACIPVWGERHPGCLGRPASEAWSEVWSDVEQLIQNVQLHGKPTKVTRMPFTMTRNGYEEETYFDFAMTPILDDTGKGLGVLDEFTEVTKQVTSDRRGTSIVKVGEACSEAHSLEELWPQFLKGLEPAVEDVPFALFYSITDDFPEGVVPPNANSFCMTDKRCSLECTVGIKADEVGLPTTFELKCTTTKDETLTGTIHRAWRSKKSTKLGGEDEPMPPELSIAVPGRGFGDTVKAVMVVPIASLSGSDTMGVLILGFNPRLPFDGEYAIYIQYLAEILLKSAALISLPFEHQRAQQISEDINSALSSQLRSMALQAERSEANFWRMAQSAPMGMFQFAADGKVVRVNDAYLEILGVPREDVDTWSGDQSQWASLIVPEDAHIPLKAWTDVVTQQAPVSCEYRTKKMWKSDDTASGVEMGGHRWVLATAFPEIEADGTISMIQGWLTDISHQKFSDLLMAQRLEDALETKRQTLNFIDLTSHEMRNPLSAILQCADSIVNTLWESGMPMIDEPLLIDHNHAEELIDCAQTIVLCAQHQKRIADDILTLSKLDASLLVISPDRVQPPALVRKAIKMYEAELARSAISVDFRLDPSYGELGVDWVLLDPSRLLQVIINLLTNAMKFTQYADERRIIIHMGASKEKPRGKRHKVSFIPRKHAQKACTFGKEWGTGEPLYLQIAVTDTGAGLSEHEMKMLFQRFSQASPKTYKQYGGSGLGLFISRELCELQGGQIGVASHNGKTTFTFYVWATRWEEEAAGGNATLPVPERGSSPSFSNAPTAFSRKGSASMDTMAQHNVQQQERSQNEQSGTTTLPLRNGSSISKSTSRSRPTPNPDPVNGQTVLIVEDNVINQQLLAAQLKKAGWKTHVANHGLECLDHLSSTHFCAPQTSTMTAKPLHIILLDLEMPIMDGLTCIREIRARQLDGRIVGHVPVIAVTANARSEQISVAIEAGMDLVVTKPFRIPELVPQMRGLIAEVAERYGTI